MTHEELKAELRAIRETMTEVKDEVRESRTLHTDVALLKNWRAGVTKAFWVVYASLAALLAKSFLGK